MGRACALLALLALLARASVAARTVDVIGMGVVDGMRPLPRKVGDEEGGVQDVADGVLQQAVIREGAVAALVRQHPQAHRRCARHEGVGNPQRQRDQLERDEKAKRGSGPNVSTFASKLPFSTRAGDNGNLQSNMTSIDNLHFARLDL